MRHVTLTTLAIATAAVAIVACEEQAPERGLTAPDAVSFGKQLGGECDAARLRLITTQQGDIYNKPQLDSAKAMMESVTSQCSTQTGENLMLAYIQFTIDHRSVDKSTVTNAQLLDHWNTVFPYVGFTGSSMPGSLPIDSVFGPNGAAKVIKWDVGGEIKALN
ncbi:MAG TPA: hypothetical protein VF042_01225, partial [Gemmatimonadaceae bacterium]